MSKNPNQLPNCLKIAETGIVLICLNGIHTVAISYCCST